MVGSEEPCPGPVHGAPSALSCARTACLPGCSPAPTFTAAMADGEWAALGPCGGGGTSELSHPAPPSPLTQRRGSYDLGRPPGLRSHWGLSSGYALGTGDP